MRSGGNVAVLARQPFARFGSASKGRYFCDPRPASSQSGVLDRLVSLPTDSQLSSELLLVELIGPFGSIGSYRHGVGHGLTLAGTSSAREPPPL